MGIRAGRVPISRRDVFIYRFFFRINRPTASTYNGSRNFFNIGERNFLIRNRLAEKKKNKFRDSFSRLLITFEWNRNAMFICQRRIDVSDFTFAQKICRIFKFSMANRWILCNGVANLLKTFDREKIKARCTTCGSSKGRPKRKNVRAWTIFLEIIVDIGYAMFISFFFRLFYFILFYFFLLLLLFFTENGKMAVFAILWCAFFFLHCGKEAKHRDDSEEIRESGVLSLRIEHRFGLPIRFSLIQHAILLYLFLSAFLFIFLCVTPFSISLLSFLISLLSGFIP